MRAKPERTLHLDIFKSTNISMYTRFEENRIARLTKAHGLLN